MSRPTLTAQLSPTEFRAFYWLKEELAGFCRAHGLSASGSKEELAARIEAFLRIGERPPAIRRARPSARMPEQFRRTDVIGEGWRCSQALRAFFEQEIGPAFHFDHVMRDFIRDGAGRTLDEAIRQWHDTRGAPPREIGAQFEFNRHVRAYFEAHPGATREDAIAAWWEKRGRRRDEPPEPA